MFIYNEGVSSFFIYMFHHTFNPDMAALGAHRLLISLLIIKGLDRIRPSTLRIYPVIIHPDNPQVAMTHHLLIQIITFCSTYLRSNI